MRIPRRPVSQPASLRSGREVLAFSGAARAPASIGMNAVRDVADRHLVGRSTRPRSRPHLAVRRDGAAGLPRCDRGGLRASTAMSEWTRRIVLRLARAEIEELFVIDIAQTRAASRGDVPSVGVNRSMPAGTGVCVVNISLRRHDLPALLRSVSPLLVHQRPNPLQPQNAQWPSFMWIDGGCQTQRDQGPDPPTPARSPGAYARRCRHRRAVGDLLRSGWGALSGGWRRAGSRVTRPT